MNILGLISQLIGIKTLRLTVCSPVDMQKQITRFSKGLNINKQGKNNIAMSHKHTQRQV